MKYALDTNAIVAALNGVPQVTTRLAGLLGRAKSDFDLAIASIALVHAATLVTSDTALLDGSINGLLVENWLAASPSHG